MLNRLRGVLLRPGLAPSAFRSLSAQAQPATASRGAHWWENDSLDCHGLYRNLVNKLDQDGPQKPAALMALFDKCETEEDALRAVKACRRLRGQRSRRGINHSLDPAVTMSLVSASKRTGNLEAGLDALRRCHELQLTPVAGAFRALMVAYSQRGQPRGVLESFDAMKAAGVRPTSDTAFALIRAFVDCGLPEAAQLAVAEFEANGVAVPAAAQRLLQSKQPGSALVSDEAAPAGNPADEDGAMQPAEPATEDAAASDKTEAEGKPQ